MHRAIWSPLLAEWGSPRAWYDYHGCLSSFCPSSLSSLMMSQSSLLLVSIAQVWTDISQLLFNSGRPTLWHFPVKTSTGPTPSEAYDSEDRFVKLLHISENCDTGELMDPDAKALAKH